MLPFLKNKNQPSVAGLIMKTRAPDESPEQEDSEDSSAAIESCASEIIRAVHAKDPKAVAAALKDAFDILESMPHEEESESTEPHSYDAQNIKAGRE